MIDDRTPEGFESPASASSLQAWCIWMDQYRRGSRWVVRLHLHLVWAGSLGSREGLRVFEDLVQLQAARYLTVQFSLISSGTL